MANKKENEKYMWQKEIRQRRTHHFWYYMVEWVFDCEQVTKYFTYARKPNHVSRWYKKETNLASIA